MFRLLYRVRENIPEEKMKNKWISIWSNALSVTDHKPEEYAKDITLRYPIDIPFDGEEIRLVLDNFTGTEEVSFEKITIAIAENNLDLIEETLQSVTFEKKGKVKLNASENKLSDPIPLKVKKGDRILVSIYLKEYTQMRSSVRTFGPLSKAFYSLGNQTEKRTLPLETTLSISNFYFLSRVDLLAEESCKSVICYGDSITAQAWPEYLKLIYMNNNENRTAIRRGISGSRILRQYDCLHYESFGYKGLVRFPHEMESCGVDTIIILHGVNDIIQPVGIEENPFRPWNEMPDLEELKEGIRFYIEKAKEAGFKVYLGTIMPIEGWHSYAPFKNELRKKLNDWIRNLDEVDGILDFDKEMCDRTHPDRLYLTYDSGDHLHPSDEGHRKMAEIVYQSLKND